MLAAGLLALGGAPIPAAADEERSVYAMDIEFGSLSFYYDYGNWNVNTMRYEADANSTGPADGTTSGFPGWYGFDGTSNKIVLKNGSVNGSPITVSMNYRGLNDDEVAAAGAEHAVKGVSMIVTGDAWTLDSGNRYTAVIPATRDAGGYPVPVEAYIHLSGEPKLENSSPYESQTLQPIGMLIIKIESPLS